MTRKRAFEICKLMAELATEVGNDAYLLRHAGLAERLKIALQEARSASKMLGEEIPITP